MAAAHTAAHKSQSVLGSIALALVIIGAINWGLVGLFGIDIVAALFGDMTTLSRIVYVLIGLAGLYSITLYPRVARSPTTTTPTHVGLGQAPGHPQFVERRKSMQPAAR